MFGDKKYDVMFVNFGGTLVDVEDIYKSSINKALNELVEEIDPDKEHHRHPLYITNAEWGAVYIGQTVHFICDLIYDVYCFFALDRKDEFIGKFEDYSLTHIRNSLDKMIENNSFEIQKQVLAKMKKFKFHKRNKLVLFSNKNIEDIVNKFIADDVFKINKSVDYVYCNKGGDKFTPDLSELFKEISKEDNLDIEKINSFYVIDDSASIKDYLENGYNTTGVKSLYSIINVQCLDKKQVIESVF